MPPKRVPVDKKNAAVASGGVKKKVTAKGYKKPIPIPNGEILTDLSKNQWKIGPSIGSGGFGEIYCAAKIGESGKDYSYVVKIEPHENGPLFVERTVYIKIAKSADIEAFRKKRKLKSLGMPHFLGNGSHVLNNTKHRFVVMPRYGRDVWSFFLENGKKLPTPTIYRIAIQMFDVLEYIHEKTYIHADLKGANILLGQGKHDAGQVYLVDFGLASHYTTKEYKVDPKKRHNGTIEYTSRDAHNGIPTMRSDLEILAYNIVHWSGVTLPWEADGLLSSPDKVQQSKQNFMSNTEASLKSCFPSCPDVVKNYLKYVSSLEYNDIPNYDKCRKMFEAALKDLGESNSGDLKFKITPSAGSSKKPAANDVTSASPRKRVAKPQPKVRDEAESDESATEIENESPKKSRKRPVAGSSSPSKNRSDKRSKNTAEDKHTSAATPGSIVVNNHLTPTDKKKKSKTYNFNFELDVSIDANVVINVKRKKKDADKNIGSGKASKVGSSNAVAEDGEDVIPNSVENSPVAAKIRVFKNRNATSKKTPPRKSPRSVL